MPFHEAISRLEIISETIAHNTSIAGYPVPRDEDTQVCRDINHAITFLKLGQFGGLTALVSLIRLWGAERNIIGPSAKATVHSQFQKLLEEVDEVREGIEKNDQHEIIDGIGDCTVVLILLAELAGVKFEQCLVAAYDEIRDRKGSMIDGAFVKQL
jgi:NTP pyrophosphatase (non-canonical NTP hydrolase)